MPFTDGGIFYRRISGGPTLEASLESRAGGETVMMTWAQVDAFMNEALPLPQIVGGYLFRPRRRTMPGRPHLLCEKISISPWYGEICGDDPIAGSEFVTGVPAAAWAQVQISYKTADSEDEDEDDPEDPETYMTHRMSIGGEFLTIPKQKIRWGGNGNVRGAGGVQGGGGGAPAGGNPGGGGWGPGNEGQYSDSQSYTASPENGDGEIAKAEDAPVGKVIPTIEHQLTWKSVINPPFGAMVASVGTLNGGGMFGANAGHVLFLGADAQREFLTDGTVKPWTLDYRFSERPEASWNHFWRPETGRWEMVFVNGRTIYGYTNHTNLFRPAA